MSGKKQECCRISGDGRSHQTDGEARGNHQWEWAGGSTAQIRAVLPQEPSRHHAEDVRGSCLQVVLNKRAWGRASKALFWTKSAAGRLRGPAVEPCLLPISLSGSESQLCWRFLWWESWELSKSRCLAHSRYHRMLISIGFLWGQIGTHEWGWQGREALEGSRALFGGVCAFQVSLQEAVMVGLYSGDIHRLHPRT